MAYNIRSKKQFVWNLQYVGFRACSSDFRCTKTTSTSQGQPQTYKRLSFKKNFANEEGLFSKVKDVSVNKSPNNCLSPLDVLLKSPPTMTLEQINKIVLPYSTSNDDIHIQCSERQSNFKQKLNNEVLSNFTKIEIMPNYAVDDVIEYKKQPLTLLSYEYLSKSLQTPKKWPIGDVIEYLCSSGFGDSTPKGMKDGPTVEQLENLKKHISKELPKFFVARHDYRIYTPDLIFENNYFGDNRIHKGIQAYIWELNKIKITTHLKYAHAMFYVVSLTSHLEDGTIRFRWRISGLPQIKAFQFWKFMPWTYKKTLKEESVWIDGYSILSVGKDGRILKHRVERVMKDEEMVVDKKSGIAASIAVLLGLIPRPSDIHSILLSKKPKIPNVLPE